ncbi:uncharacterized protein LOC115450425 isoform X3 [Manduca sexta]|uniref:uncharacterized protein LOC115450425 isoform X3 n=1 Tax=Manduca sexta TaxID=7130 RepID=UPI00188EAC26|nr:uncharacterized protein LOC115450425 isoform X3 [Manduca sexta]XP_037300280.1 uncharacterized protein LOC115450425 isoform X3 [Manduca sexta]
MLFPKETLEKIGDTASVTQVIHPSVIRFRRRNRQLGPALANIVAFVDGLGVAAYHGKEIIRYASDARDLFIPIHRENCFLLTLLTTKKNANNILKNCVKNVNNLALTAENGKMSSHVIKHV